MFFRYGVPLIIAGVIACALLGWAVAWWYDKRAEERRKMEENDDAGQ